MKLRHVLALALLFVLGGLAVLAWQYREAVVLIPLLVLIAAETGFFWFFSRRVGISSHRPFKRVRVTAPENRCERACDDSRLGISDGIVVAALC